jgi:filamentous hemagglutinin
MLGAVTKSTAAVVDGSKIGMSWAGNWFERGYAFEKFLETLFPGAKLPDRFKTFDFFKKATGEAISAKTLDTNTLARIARPETVRYTINGYINKMLNFTTHELEKFKLTPEMITAKELHLAIPANTSPIHMQQIEHCIQYGIDNRVKVVITKVK